jgi:hypothetical protein
MSLGQGSHQCKQRAKIKSIVRAKKIDFFWGEIANLSAQRQFLWQQ